ncbi:hypothetical protein SVI_2040 [Shewanella violacea DSS12]|uniref:Uncharacterized protein n=1 Tax=Shewanella violacea (strain JCM 10179 / CIP 106290 / LMG 19151 / DSS12) TaxID=637905 RepID=D4ZK12_SHEVD|nr:hypothetical protein SVI_2040 [Shewanella violacea DSS12]
MNVWMARRLHLVLYRYLLQQDKKHFGKDII